MRYNTQRHIIYTIVSLAGICSGLGVQRARAQSAISDSLINIAILSTETGLAGGSHDLYAVIAAIINIALSFAGIAGVIVIIFSGYRWITAAGNEEQVRSARRTLRGAIIGLVIIAASFIITNYVVVSILNAINPASG